MKRYYIGISCTFHDPAIAIVDDQGEVLFAEASERYLQNKRAYLSPGDDMFRVTKLLKKYCQPNSHFTICFSWSKRHIKKFTTPSGLLLTSAANRILKFFVPNSPGSTLSIENFNWMYETQKAVLSNTGANTIRALKESFSPASVRKVFFKHHLSHAAYACYTSPFKSGICFVLDGHGESGPISLFNYKEGKISLIARQKNHASIGLLYDAITKLCSYSPLKGEQWKIMGLAPYGQLNKALYELLEDMLVVDNYFLKFTSILKFKNGLINMFEKFAPSTEEEIADIAYTGQLFFSKLVTQLLQNVYKLNISDNLIYCGGCALNSSFNGTILQKQGFKKIHIPPAPGDDGNALGAALMQYYTNHQNAEQKHKMLTPYLGSRISQTSIANLLNFGKLAKVRKLSENELFAQTASKLAEGKLVGWIQGRAEFGPRALGNRSILADPRDKEMKAKINSLVKFREGFRPFAPAILNEHGDEYFDNYDESRYMEKTGKFKHSHFETVPAVVHVDYTGRFQSVTKEWNERFYKLIKAFHKLTGVPVLLNTSCNVMGKPIVHSLEDCVGLFFTTGLEVLVIDDLIIEK